MVRHLSRKARAIRAERGRCCKPKARPGRGIVAAEKSPYLVLSGEHAGRVVTFKLHRSPHRLCIVQIVARFPWLINMLIASRTVVFPELFAPTTRLTRPKSFIRKD